MKVKVALVESQYHYNYEDEEGTSTSRIVRDWETIDESQLPELEAFVKTYNQYSPRLRRRGLPANLYLWKQFEIADIYELKEELEAIQRENELSLARAAAKRAETKAKNAQARAQKAAEKAAKQAEEEREMFLKLKEKFENVSG